MKNIGAIYLWKDNIQNLNSFFTSLPYIRAGKHLSFISPGQFLPVLSDSLTPLAKTGKNVHEGYSGSVVVMPLIVSIHISCPHSTSCKC